MVLSTLVSNLFSVKPYTVVPYQLYQLTKFCGSSAFSFSPLISKSTYCCKKPSCSLSAFSENACESNRLILA